MTRLLRLFTFLGGTAMTIALAAAPTSTEFEAAKGPLKNYIKAHETGDATYIRMAFRNDARVVGELGGKQVSWSLEDYAARFAGTPAADELERKRSIEILDVTGSAAIGKAILDYPEVKFTDYMSLLKVDGEWKIVCKSFSAEIKTKATKKPATTVK
jgi:Putative lumazine-binding